LGRGKTDGLSLASHLLEHDDGTKYRRQKPTFTCEQFALARDLLSQGIAISAIAKTTDACLLRFLRCFGLGLTAGADNTCSISPALERVGAGRATFALTSSGTGNDFLHERPYKIPLHLVHDKWIISSKNSECINTIYKKLVRVKRAMDSNLYFCWRRIQEYCAVPPNLSDHHGHNHHSPRYQGVRFQGEVKLAAVVVAKNLGYRA
jgi:hypothetical protein